MVKILDCTIRDGGYYTNWDFDRNLVDTYIKACNDLPVDYLEVGYRSIPLEGYYGEYFYLPVYVMQRLKAQTTKKLVVILNEKDIKPNQVKGLLSPCLGLIDMVRLAIDPKQFARAVELARVVKDLGFEVGFNVMYMSKWKGQKDFLELLPKVKDIANYFYMVDSYGGVYPQDVKDTIQLVRSYIPDVPLGFHGHNNMELALINTLTAIEEGCEMVDATITGMGRGAGNVKTELLLTALNAQGKVEVDFNPLSKIVDGFTDLQKKHGWGTNLPYMVSGAHSLPQKDVMDWVGKRYYSFNSIVRALQNQAKGVSDNNKFELMKKETARKAIVIGGGSSVLRLKEAIIKFIEAFPDVVIIHSSSKNARILDDINVKQFFCLVGNEGYRMEDVFEGAIPDHVVCILPSYPRKMGTYVPKAMLSKSFELSDNNIFEPYKDSHTAIALSLVLSLKVEELFIIGYDGYSEAMSLKEQELFNENSYMFEKLKAKGNLFCCSLTETKYNLKTKSIFAYTT
jgi:4-hydroxy 2-oxovalerate aldolase